MHNCLNAAWLKVKTYYGFLLSVSHLASDIKSFVPHIPGWGCKARNFSVTRTQVQAYKPSFLVIQEWARVAWVQLLWLFANISASRIWPSVAFPLQRVKWLPLLQPGQEPWGLPGCNMGQHAARAIEYGSCQHEGRGTPEHPGGDAASWVALCPSQPLTLQPGLAAWGQPAPGGRTVMGTSPRPPTTLVDNGSPPFRGRDGAARIRGHRELCLCLIWLPDVPDWRWQRGDCQKLCGGGDVIWEIVFLPADTFGLAVKKVSCP